MRTIKTGKMLLHALLLSYIALFVFKNQIETNLTFPGKGMKNGYIPPDFIEINIPDKNGNNINGLVLDNKNPKTILYFHGNGEPISYYTGEMRFLGSLGYNVAGYDYPGYGKSGGYPMEQTVYDFSEAFYAYLQKTRHLKNEDTIVVGYSVGTAAATDFASKNAFDKLILFAPLTSRYDMSRAMFGFSIQKLVFMPNSFNSEAKVTHIANPLLVVQGNADTVIPFTQGKTVFEKSAAASKYFITVDGF